MRGGSRRFQLGIMLALLAGARGVMAADEQPLIDAQHFDRPPVIDGHLDEPEWQQAQVISRLRQIRPGNGEPPSEATEIRVGYDKRALYLAAKLVDRRGAGGITANVMKQGARLPDDDRIAFIIDPSGTGRGAYRFEVNLNSVRNDMLYQGGQPQAEWSAIWEAKAALTDDGWNVEIAIPFRSLPFDPKATAWGFNVSRAIRSRGEESVWVSRNRSWGPSITGRLSGIRDVDGGFGLDVVPTLGLRALRNYGNAPDTEEANPSIDLYYRLTPSLTASFTANTDFSATDADQRQVNLTRFSLFFPEKRDFFLNDADLFDFGRIGGSDSNNNPLRSITRAGRESGRPFFSRKLGLSPVGTPVDLQYGGKVSGRTGRFRIGLLSVHQDGYVPVTGPTLRASTLSVVRLAADILSESSVGFIATNGDPLSNDHNSLVGADFLYQNTRFAGGRTLEGEAWVQQSDSTGAIGSETAFGVGARVNDADGWRYGANYRQLGSSFRPALGFVSRAGVRSIGADGGYMHMVRGPLLQSVYMGADGYRTESLGGALQSQVITLRPAELDSARRDTLRFYYAMSREVLTRPFVIFSNVRRSVVIPVGSYRFSDYGADFSTGQQRRLGVRLNVRRGEFYDGRRLGMGTELSWKASRHFTLRGSYDFDDITLPAGKFTTRVLAAGADISFTSNLFWTNLIQYDNVSETAALQTHLHYIPKAGQSFNLIINRGSEDLDKDGHFRALSAEYGARLSYTFRY